MLANEFFVPGNGADEQKTRDKTENESLIRINYHFPLQAVFVVLVDLFFNFPSFVITFAVEERNDESGDENKSQSE